MTCSSLCLVTFARTACCEPVKKVYKLDSINVFHMIYNLNTFFRTNYTVINIEKTAVLGDEKRDHLRAAIAGIGEM